MIAALNRRGYIGPLGDDFPSIFPIAMGLMFFFSAITLTYDYYDLKQKSATLMDANAALGKAARSQAVFDDDYWTKTCDIVDKTKANYGVRAKLELLRYDRVSKDWELVTNLGGGIENPCVDTVDEKGDPLPDPRTFSISLTYPTLIQATEGNEIATLRLTTW